MFLLGLTLTTILSSYALTYWAITSAGRFGFQDIPNERSSHSVPMPRWGGIAIFINFVLPVLVLTLRGTIDKVVAFSLLIGASIVFAVGLWDDRFKLPARVRLVVHFVAALWTLLFVTDNLLYGLQLHIGVAHITNVWIASIFCLLFIAWMINLYNFMDGIDGLAGSQAVIVSLALSALSYWQNHQSLAVVYLALGLSSTGFLYFNWSPARIFMGDGGSGFLGFIFAALALIGELRGGLPLLTTAFLLSGFITDATYTLIVRLFLGFRPYDPHREFGFQRLIQRGWGAQRVNAGFAMVTGCWSLPLAILCILKPEISGTLVVITYAPLVSMAYFLKAGLPLSPNAQFASTLHPSVLGFDEIESDSLPIFASPRPFKKSVEISQTELH